MVAFYTKTYRLPAVNSLAVNVVRGGASKTITSTLLHSIKTWTGAFQQQDAAIKGSLGCCR